MTRHAYISIGIGHSEVLFAGTDLVWRDFFKMLIKAPEVGKLLDVSTWQVYQLAGEKKLPGIVKLAARTIRFNREVIEQWIANGCPPVDTKGQAEAAHVG